MKLNSVVDCVGIDRDIKIMEGKECKYSGNALDFMDKNSLNSSEAEVY